MKTLSLVVSSLALVAGCSDGGGKKMVTPPVDAPMNMIDAAPACSVPANLTSATNFAAGYQADRDNMVTGNQEYWIANGDLDAEVIRDIVSIELYEGPPPGFTVENFPAVPFTIQLTGNETDYFKCSMCISIYADADTQGDSYLDDYMATGGSVTITALSPTEITGTLNNVTFGHVMFANNMHTPHPSGCSTTTGTIPFTAVPEMLPPPMSFQADGRARRRAARF